MDVSSELSLAYMVNVSHQQSAHILVYSAFVGIRNALVALKPN